MFRGLLDNTVKSETKTLRSFKIFTFKTTVAPSLGLTVDWLALQFNEFTQHEYMPLLIPVAYRAKVWIFKLLVLPVVPYGFEKWTLNSNLKGENWYV